MSIFLLEHYSWLKALHVISIIAWMAGLLYLPRLFVYHSDVVHGSGMDKTFQVMERRLLRFIMNPAMIAAWVFGGLMIAANPALFDSGWLHVKLTCVILLSVLHMVFAKWRKNFATGRNNRAAKFYKIWNEAPTLLMVIIVVMAIVKPF